MKTWTDEQFINAIKTSTKYIEVSQKLGLTNLGANYKTIKKYINNMNLDISHFLSRKQLAQNARDKIKILSDEELFSINSVDRKYIKKIILQKNLIPYECSTENCKIQTWFGKNLSLHLDHINGINNDNRLENLRFLCPNCHSLTETYCIKKKNNDPNTKKYNFCKDCNAHINQLSNYCRNCVKNHKTTIKWPSDQILITMVKQSNYTKVGVILGVSANSVKKRLHSKRLLNILAESGPTIIGPKE